VIVQCVECGNRWNLTQEWIPPVEQVNGRIRLYCAKQKRPTQHIYRGNPKAAVRTSDRKY
jgi:hypothetical protein